jgi:hypothetical protein
MQVYFDIAADDTAKGANEFVNLARVCTTNSVGNADAVNPNFIYRLVDGKEIDEVGAEGILRREADLNAFWLDKVDDLDRGLGDIGHVLAMRKFTEEGWRANDDIDAIYARLDGDAGIIHMATDVGEDFGFQTELADGLTVLSRLFRGCWWGELQIFDAKFVEGFGDGDFGLGVKESIGKLLPLCARSYQQEWSGRDDKDRNLGECSRWF